jgi:hypothetical protein
MERSPAEDSCNLWASSEEEPKLMSFGKLRRSVQLTHRRTAPDARARARGPRRHDSIRRHTARRRPNRCAAHREPFSCVEVDVRTNTGHIGGQSCSWIALGRRKAERDALASDVWRGAAERDAGFRRRVSDKGPCEQPPPLGASSEGRVAWPAPPVLPATFASRPVR